MLKYVLVILFSISSVTASASKSIRFIDEGHLLANQLIDVLIDGGICHSYNDCRRGDGFIFYKSKENGIDVFAYSIKRSDIAAKLLQVCATQFATKSLGIAMSVEIFDITQIEYRSQSFFRKTQPKLILKLEKSNVNY